VSQTAETNLYADRDITERLREHAAIHEAQVPFDNEQREWADDLRFAAAEIARLRARVAKLESARGEPVAWMNPYGGTLQVRITGLEYEKYTIPLYTAPPAQAVDARRYRRLFDCPEPFCYRGEVFETKVVADNAIDTDMRKTP
jgi:hypothetical protein